MRKLIVCVVILAAAGLLAEETAVFSVLKSMTPLGKQAREYMDAGDLVPDEITQFCAGKRAVLMVEEGHPDYLEQAVNALLRKADLNTSIVGKAVLPMAGEYIDDRKLSDLKDLLAFEPSPL